MVKTLGLSGRKSPVQTILILLVESGLAYLGFQVSHFYILLVDTSCKILKVLTFFIDSVFGLVSGYDLYECSRAAILLVWLQNRAFFPCCEC